MIFVATLLIAADAGSVADELPGIGILGGSVIGVMLLLGLFGWIWFKPAVDDLRARLTKTEDQRDTLIKVYEDKILPFLEDQREKVIPALSDLASGMKELTDVVKDIRRDVIEVKSREIKPPRGRTQ